MYWYGQIGGVIGLKSPAPFGILLGPVFAILYLSGIKLAESDLVIWTFPGSSLPLGRVSNVPSRSTLINGTSKGTGSPLSLKNSSDFKIIPRLYPISLDSKSFILFHVSIMVPFAPSVVEVGGISPPA